MKEGSPEEVTLCGVLTDELESAWWQMRDWEFQEKGTVRAGAQEREGLGGFGPLSDCVIRSQV